VLQLGRNWGTEVIGQRLERDARDELYASLLGKSMTFHSLQPVGDTMARATNDVREVNLMLNPGMNLVVGSANFLLVPILLAPRYHPSLVIPPLVFIGLYFLALRQYLRSLAPITRTARASFGRMNATLTEAIDGIEVVKGSAREEHEVALFGREADAYRRAAWRQGEQEARFLPLLLLGVTVSVGFLQALVLFQRGLLSVGDVVAYMGLLQLFGFPTFAAQFAYSQVSSGLSSAERILELVNRETELGENATGHAAAMAGDIRLDGVDFAYGPGQPALSGVSLHVPPGQTVALVGQTGAGKTTIVKLLARFHDPTSGSVRVDGHDLRTVMQASLRRQMGIVLQDPFLFNGTVKENLLFGRLDASDEEVVAAARAVGAHDFITALRNGYDSPVEEGGVLLSVGQRQLISFARALLADPRILILDEATSSVDTQTEQVIQRALARLFEGRTSFVIAHRLSTITNADRIVVIHDGRIVEQGKHEELLEKQGVYYELYKTGFQE
jgi:ATP-binding cassette subfamily B protein